MESVVRALVVWVRANLLLLLTLAGVVVGVILGAVLSWRLMKLHEYKYKGDHHHTATSIKKYFLRKALHYIRSVPSTSEPRCVLHQVRLQPTFRNTSMYSSRPYPVEL